MLARGHELAPADAAIAMELEGLYRTRKAWALLTGLLESRAEHEPAPERAVPLLLEAARLLETELADAARAMATLKIARARQPENVEVVEAFARALASRGELDAAVAEVTAAIAASAGAKGADPARSLPLSLLLAELEGARGNHRAAVAELRGILDLEPDVVAERLEKALEVWRATAAAAGSPAELRAATLELAEQTRWRGDVAGARQLITELLQTAEPDAEMMRLHADLAEADGDVAAAVDATYNLMQLEQGEAQVAAANRLVVLAARANRTPDAVAAVEQLVAADPGRQELVDLLVRLYEQAGEQGKLATLLYDAGCRAEDEDQRFELLRRAGAISLEMGDSSLAIMALNESLAIRPGDEASGLLASDAYVLAGALDDAAATLKPFVAAYKGKASPALAILHARLAHIAALAGDAKEELAALTRALDADKKNGEIMVAVADRAEAAGDLDLALKALRLITANNASGPIIPGGRLPATGPHRRAPRRARTRRHVRAARGAGGPQGRSDRARGPRAPRRPRGRAGAPAPHLIWLSHYGSGTCARPHEDRRVSSSTRRRHPSVPAETCQNGRPCSPSPVRGLHGTRPRVLGALLAIGLSVGVSACGDAESLAVSGPGTAAVGELAVYSAAAGLVCPDKVFGGPSDPTGAFIICHPYHNLTKITAATCDGDACVVESIDPPSATGYVALHVVGSVAGPTVLRVRAELDDGSQLDATASISFVTPTGLHASCDVSEAGVPTPYGQCGGFYPVFANSYWRWIVSFESDAGLVPAFDPSIGLQGSAIGYDATTGWFGAGPTDAMTQVVISTRQFTETVPVRVVSLGRRGERRGPSRHAGGRHRARGRSDRPRTEHALVPDNEWGPIRR